MAILVLVACKTTKKRSRKTCDSTRTTSGKESPALDFDHKAYKMKGMLLAKSTFKVFKSKIEEVGSKQGLLSVVDFCYDNAQKLTDSMAKVNNVIIRRTSHKLRNSKNEPTDAEKDVLNQYLEMINENQRIEPIVRKEKDGYVHFYAPIKLKEKCLQCHGKHGSEIKDGGFEKNQRKIPGRPSYRFQSR